MSGVFGIYNRNGDSVGQDTVDMLLTGLSYWNPDEKRIWHGGDIALGHGMLWNTPESRNEQLPGRKDCYIITLDARLDNRAELFKELDIASNGQKDVTDSELIIEAYRKWGVKCPGHLLGDFVFAIWDERKKQLFCARDHVGVKQLYYYSSGSYFVFANDLKVLLRYPGISTEPCDGAVADYLIYGELLSLTKTFFQKIKKLPGGYSLLVSTDRVEKKCYWRLEDAPKIEFSTAEEYAERLRGLLIEAVYCRMRSVYPIVSHLSGGLDSSTIAVIAARKLRKQGKRLLAFNWVHEPEKEDDFKVGEWANSRIVAENEDIDHNYVNLNVADICNYIKNRDIACGDFSRFWYEYKVREGVQQSGARTILSGWGGDELATYHDQAYYADLISQGKILSAINELRHKAYRYGKPPAKYVVREISYNLFRFIPKQIYMNIAGRKFMKNCSHYLFVKKLFLPFVYKILKNPPVLFVHPKRNIRDHMLASWNNGHVQGRMEAWGAASFANRLEYSYPLLDKRVVEFMVGVPPKYLVKKGVGRYLFRSAAKGFLPDSLLWCDAKLERARVERLLQLQLSVVKKLVKDEMLKKIDSDYIDYEKVKDAINRLELIPVNRKKVETIVSMITSLSLLLSSHLTKKM